jgi:hypothetical protein
MQAEVVKADQGVQIAETHDASVKKATGDATSVKISAEAMQKQSRLMQMQKHQNNCNGVAWWCHFSKDNQNRSI